MNKLYIDTETTGFSPKYNSMINFAGILTSTNSEGEEFVIKAISERFMPTKHDWSCNAFEVHGIPTYSLTQPYVNVLPEIETLFKATDIIIGHNLQFDLNFLNESSVVLKNVIEEKLKYCTMKDCSLGRKFIYQDKSYNKTKAFASLDDLINNLVNFHQYTEERLENEFLEIFPEEKGSRHTASFDAFICYLINKVHKLV